MSEVAFWTAVVLLVLLCAGTPDLLDAMIQYVLGHAKC